MTCWLAVTALLFSSLFAHPDHHLNQSQSHASHMSVRAVEPVSSWSESLHDLYQLLNLEHLIAWVFRFSSQPARDATLSVTIRDAKSGDLTPVRVLLTDANGNPVGKTETGLAVPGSVRGLPAQAIGVMYGRYDQAEGFAYQPNGAFYVNGSFQMPLPEGTYTLTLSKGYEFVQQTETLTLEAGESLSRDYVLQRWIDMPERGWYSGDDHIHIRRSPREDPLILDWIAAEDVHVGILLQMGDFWSTFYSQYGWGEEGRFRKGNHILSSGQEEPRTPELGHTISLGATEFVRFRDEYYSYDKVFDRIHELGGVTGYAHQATSFNGPRGMTLDVLQEKIDFLEVMQFCVQEGPLALEQYYRFLDLGYKLTALGGSDFPWCGRGPRFGVDEVGSQIGDARFYTYTGQSFSFDRWLDGVKAGHTFVTSGPMLDFKVNDRLPGDSLNVEAGTNVRILARAYGHSSQIPLSRLQIVGHGKVLKEVSVTDPGQSLGELSVEFEFPVERGIWIAARADAGPTQTAHSTPIYITTNGKDFHNPDMLAHYIDVSRKYLEEIRGALTPPEERVSPESIPSTPRAWLYSGFRESLSKRVMEVEAELDQLERTKSASSIR
ncbi:MAG TPA: CehA/McbA family metallohydrolase [Acidobacteriota bacterium]|nr:CehA/McbA family metallohydrolase [Acidobacteriota bacterium]